MLLVPRDMKPRVVESGSREANLGEQLLIPAARAAWKLGISRQSLRRLIKAGEVKAVKIGNMRGPFVPQTEIARIVSGRAKTEAAFEDTSHESQTRQTEADPALPGQRATTTAQTPRDRILALAWGES
jgi:hypothetical protein